MSLIFITGIAGSGKTTLLSELKKQNYEAYDADESLCYWANKMTGEKVLASDHTATTHPDFFKDHDWYIDTTKVAELAKKAGHVTVFVCGSIANEQQVWRYFDKVFCLYVGNDLLAQRVMNRTDKDFGKSEHELAHLLQLNENVMQKYTALGAVLLDANRPVDELARDVTSRLQMPQYGDLYI